MDKNDLISRSAAMEIVKRTSGDYAAAWVEIRRLPAVAPKDLRPGGRWIEKEDEFGNVHYICSECGEDWQLFAGTPAENNMNFCPQCGARMEG